MSEALEAAATRAELLAHDAARERRTLWKGMISLLGVIAVGFARQRWWL